jgi:hypothetical protein
LVQVKNISIDFLFMILKIFIILAHGTFIGHIRLEDHKPQQVHIDSEIHFGESSRIYIIRERPQTHANKLHHIFGSNANTMNSNTDANGDYNDENKDANNSFSIPESEIELDVRNEIRKRKV